MRRLKKMKDDGFSLVWLAMILAVLLGMAGFGTDLGWLYLNTVRTQNAVDAAALAGVVNLPGFDPAPDAKDAVEANGIGVGVLNGISTGTGGPGTLTTTETSSNELHAELRTSVEPFFMRIFGFDQFNITRDASAQYVKPVPLGSPSNCFGGGNTIPNCSGNEDFWAAVSGRETRLEDGDPFSTLCDDNTGGPACVGSNPNYERGGSYPGYYYAVEVSAGDTGLSVHIWDAGFEDQGRDVGTGDLLFSPGDPPAINTRFRLYPPDTTPLIPDDHLSGGPICTENYNPGTAFKANWTQLCSTIASPTEGLYLVHVETTNNSAGSNNFALRAETTSAGDPRIYGINDMSIWSNGIAADSEMWIAEIEEEHAGKKLELAFFDAGDAFAESWYYVNDPFGSVPTCTWTIWSADYPLSTATQLSSGGPGLCQWKTQNNSPPSHRGIYNKQWIVAIIDLPSDPVDMCDEGQPAGEECFWKMDLDLASPTERTTWRARVIGNPVRLLP